MKKKLKQNIPSLAVISLFSQDHNHFEAFRMLLQSIDCEKKNMQLKLF